MTTFDCTFLAEMSAQGMV